RAAAVVAQPGASGAVDDGQPAARTPSLRVRPDRPALPALPDPDPPGDARAVAAGAQRLVVSALPARAGRMTTSARLVPLGITLPWCRRRTRAARRGVRCAGRSPRSCGA